MAGILVGTAKYSTRIDTGGTGSYTWAINPVGMTGSDYKVSIQCTEQDWGGTIVYIDTSNNYFTLTPAGTITVTSPNGGQFFVMGSHPTITWTSSGAVGSYLNIPDNPWVKEQQDFSNGLKIITATDDAFNPLRVRRGDRFPPSHVWVGGNSRKSSETTSRSITIKSDTGQ